jgi:hypothetical protein
MKFIQLLSESIESALSISVEVAYWMTKRDIDGERICQASQVNDNAEHAA